MSRSMSMGGLGLALRLLPCLLLSCPLLALAVASAAEAEAEPTASARQAAATVLELLATGDADMEAVALERVRYGLPGAWFTALATDRLPGLPLDRQARLLGALADRGDPVALPAARSLAASGDEAVRIAATGLIGRLGQPEDLAMLLAALARGGRDAAVARRALIEFPAAEAVRAAAATAPPATQAVLIEVLADRRDRQALPIFAAAADGDPSVRPAALGALARFGTGRELDALVRSFFQTTGDQRKAAEAAIVAICTTGSDAGAAAEALVSGFAKLDPERQEALLPVLARVGGPAVMLIVDGLVAEPTTRRRGLGALARWPDATVTDRLLAIHAATDDAEEKQLILNALIRIAPLPDNRLDDSSRLALLETTLGLCDRADDRARVIERANAIRTYEAFQFVSGFLDDPTLADAACRSVVELAHHRKLRDAHKAEFIAALDKVLAISNNPELRERATRYKAGKTWDRKQKG